MHTECPVCAGASEAAVSASKARRGPKGGQILIGIIIYQNATDANVPLASAHGYPDTATGFFGDAYLVYLLQGQIHSVFSVFGS